MATFITKACLPREVAPAFEAMTGAELNRVCAVLNCPTDPADIYAAIMALPNSNTAGYVLHSNGSSLYFAVDDQGSAATTSLPATSITAGVFPAGVQLQSSGILGLCAAVNACLTNLPDGGVGVSGVTRFLDPQTGTMKTLPASGTLNCAAVVSCVTSQPVGSPAIPASTAVLGNDGQFHVLPAPGSVPVASDTIAGVVSLAVAGNYPSTSNTEATTPAYVTAAIAAIPPTAGVPNATDTVAGVSSLAVAANYPSTSNTEATTPAYVNTAIASKLGVNCLSALSPAPANGVPVFYTDDSVAPNVLKYWDACSNSYKNANQGIVIPPPAVDNDPYPRYRLYPIGSAPAGYVLADGSATPACNTFDMNSAYGGTIAAAWTNYASPDSNSPNSIAFEQSKVATTPSGAYYVTTSQNAVGTQPSLQKFDPITQTYTTISTADLPSGGFNGAGVAATDTHVYLLGGFTGASIPVARFSRVDVVTGAETVLANPPFVSAETTGYAVGGKLYYVGGEITTLPSNVPTFVRVYDIAAQTWQSFAAPAGVDNWTGVGLVLDGTDLYWIGEAPSALAWKFSTVSNTFTSYPIAGLTGQTNEYAAFTKVGSAWYYRTSINGALYKGTFNGSSFSFTALTVTGQQASNNSHYIATSDKLYALNGDGTSQYLSLNQGGMLPPNQAWYVKCS